MLCASIIILAEEVAASNIGLYTSRHVISSARDRTSPSQDNFVCKRFGQSPTKTSFVMWTQTRIADPENGAGRLDSSPNPRKITELYMFP